MEWFKLPDCPATERVYVPAGVPVEEPPPFPLPLRMRMHDEMRNTVKRTDSADKNDPRMRFFRFDNIQRGGTPSNASTGITRARVCGRSGNDGLFTSADPETVVTVIVTAVGLVPLRNADVGERPQLACAGVPLQVNKTV